LSHVNITLSQFIGGGPIRLGEAQASPKNGEEGLGRLIEFEKKL